MALLEAAKIAHINRLFVPKPTEKIDVPRLLFDPIPRALFASLGENNEFDDLVSMTAFVEKVNEFIDILRTEIEHITKHIDVVDGDTVDTLEALITIWRSYYPELARLESQSEDLMNRNVRLLAGKKKKDAIELVHKIDTTTNNHYLFLTTTISCLQKILEKLPDFSLVKNPDLGTQPDRFRHPLRSRCEELVRQLAATVYKRAVNLAAA